MKKYFSIRNKTRSKIPNIPFQKIKNVILGSGYDLSLAFIAPKEARAVTRKTKRKDTPSNVLAFPLSKKSGEILICPATARRQAPAYGFTYRQFLARLFIHGCLHLKGFTHGSTMEKKENQLFRKLIV